MGMEKRLPHVTFIFTHSDFENNVLSLFRIGIRLSALPSGVWGCWADRRLQMHSFEPPNLTKNFLFCN